MTGRRLVYILLPGWAPYNSFNVNEDVAGLRRRPGPGHGLPLEATPICGHMGCLGTRDDMVVYQRYVNDLI